MPKARNRKSDRKVPVSGAFGVAPGRRRSAWIAPYLLIALVAAAAYSNSLSVPFIFDDVESVSENPTIRELGRPAAVLSPPPQTTVAGRPVLNLSFAINYAVGGQAVWSYHLLNILIHIGAACGVYAVARETFGRLREESIAQHAAGLSLVGALLWTAHPLQTESVTYIVQRAESLVTLFYVWTLYGVIRVASGYRMWAVPAVVLCALGMASKEVMATAPLVILLYDRAFLAGSFRDVFRVRGRLHGILWALILIAAVLNGRGRPGSAGFGEGISWIEYARTQAGVVLHYLRLVVWPHPLVLDYDWPIASSPTLILVPGGILLGVLAVTAALLWKNRPAGFALAAFFLILAPSSSVIPIVTQTAAEHRMYLPLAPLLMLIVTTAWLIIEQWAKEKSVRVGMTLTAVTVAVLAGTTFARNRDYRSPITIWQDTAGKRPRNARAHYNLGKAFEKEQQTTHAVEAYEKAIALKPDYADALANAGMVHMAGGNLERAKELEKRAVEARPDWSRTRSNLAIILSRMGDVDNAMIEYGEALRLDPNFAEGHFNLGNLYMRKGDAAEAVKCFERAVAVDPTFAPAHFNLGLWHQEQGDPVRAAESYRNAIRARPDYAKAHAQLKQVLRQLNPSQ